MPRKPEQRGTCALMEGFPACFGVYVAPANQVCDGFGRHGGLDLLQ
jgi:hypothetical protein